jgi:hypothetical protein
MKLRNRKTGEVFHAEVWDELPRLGLDPDEGYSYDPWTGINMELHELLDDVPEDLADLYPSPLVVFWSDLIGEESSCTVPCALGPEREHEWELVLSDPDELRRLREVGYCFD